MAGKTHASCLVFCTIILIFSSLNECRSLLGYKFPVYTTDLCPQNQVEWSKRSSFLNCNESSYMCLPNEHFTELLEFCYNANRVHITPSICMYLNGGNSVLNGYNCSRFKHGCPNSSYFTDEVYKYQSCLSIGKGYFLAERHYNTLSEERSDVVWIVAVTLLCVMIAICAIFHWIRKPPIRLACTLKLNGRDRSNITLNQDETTTFIAKADQNNDAVNTADKPLQTNVTEECYHTDKRRVSGKDTSSTITSIDSGISIYKGLSPLHIACARGHYDTVHQLIKNNADINACDNDGKSSLYLACEYGHVNVVELLLSGDTDVNLCDNDGASPLFIASQHGHDVIVNLLINHGADVNNKTKNFKE